mmetsp:Transcript_8596/g.13565  ORF Transcript_8596/g.13565 Transcript_8596/m.13565 type:complete len:123 (-) Transcript_8596:505-873(-)
MHGADTGPLSVRNLVEMVAASRILQIHETGVKWIESQLLPKLSIDNVAVILEAAVHWELDLRRSSGSPGSQEPSLIKGCLEKAAANLSRVSQSQSYKTCSQEVKRMISEHAVARGLSVPQEA